MMTRGRSAGNELLPALVLWGLLATACGRAADAELPLPQWSDAELRALEQSSSAAPRIGTLFELLAEDSVDRAPADSPSRPQPVADLSRFLPPSLLAAPRIVPQIAHKPPPPPLQDVDGTFLTLATREPDGFVIDPNTELHESSREQLDRFLNYHAKDARVALFVLLVGRGQRLPANFNVGTLAGGRLLSGEVCLAVVPHGEAWRTRIFLSKGVSAKAGSEALAGLLDDITAESVSAMDATEQLHRLMVRLSVRLFWVDRHLEPQPKPEPETIRPAIAVVPEATSLLEIEPDSGSDSGLAWLSVALWSLLVAGLGTWVLWRWHQYKLRHYEWLLPAQHRAIPQLGGHACGGATLLRFKVSRSG